MKKFTSLLLSVLMLLSITAGMDLSAYAATSGKCGANVTWSLNTSTGVLTLSGSGATYDYEDDTSPFSSDKMTVKSINVQKGITVISNSTFRKCSAQSVVIADTVKKIGWSAFSYCENLNSVDFPNTAIEVQSAFDNTALYDNESYWKNDMLIVDNYLLSRRGKLSGKVVVPDGIIGIASDVFYGCENITEMVLPNSLKIIGPWAIRECYNIKKINFPSNLERICEYGICWMESIEEIDLSKTKLTEIEFGALWAEANLKVLRLPATLKYIGDEAIGSEYLENIYFEGTKAQWNDVEISKEYSYPYYSLPALFEYGQITVHCSDGDIVTKNGWQKEGGVWRYYDNASAVTGWQRISNVWYYFDEYGIMQTGWQKISGSWYYFASGGAMQTGWQKIGNVWYYFKSGGQMVTGWQKIGSTWYYFKSGGAMVTGWQKIGSTWYYFKSGGAMVTGWQKISNKWYYFESSGAMRTANLKYKGKTYRFNSSGACLNP